MKENSTGEDNSIKNKSLAKTQIITFDIKLVDLARIKEIAAKKGIPYKTLISSILHECANS